MRRVQQSPWSPEDQPDPFVWLQGWYVSQCNNDWAHRYGIKIETLDNPGWSVEIDLTGTPLEERRRDRAELHRDEHDWHVSWVESSIFNGVCGPTNLGELIHVFRLWVQS